MDENRKAKIKDFLSRYFRNHELRDEEDIFALGFVNSLLAMQLVNFVEKEFRITIDDDDLDLDNFRSIAKIDGLIERKTASAAV
ncbi:MAG TPA: phosphopantetheine-binding protein [Thermoanaerobaculia bacterium]|jgi:acyl carrier protein